jgi:hypothetical protein
MKISKATVAAFALTAFGALPTGANAEPAALPSYATQPSAQETLHGRVESVVDKYKITVADDRGFVDDVTLHDGTVINPTGLTLAPGQPVTIYGHADGRTFDAAEIDTPDGGDYAVGPGYDDGAYPYPYGAYGPWAYGPYGPYGDYGYFYPGFAFGFYGGGYGGYRGYGGGYHGYGGHGYGHGGSYHGSGHPVSVGHGSASGGHGAGRH